MLNISRAACSSLVSSSPSDPMMPIPSLEGWNYTVDDLMRLSGLPNIGTASCKSSADPDLPDKTDSLL